MEFDGNTVLCQVCGDKARGFHYGVHCCEGCKRFYSRYIYENIKILPCKNIQPCQIRKTNRNRCQDCRLKKCVAVGMSRDAVRIGRIPKSEKAKILAAKQKAKERSQEKALDAELESVRNIIFQAHEETYTYTKEKVIGLLEKARNHPVYTECPSKLCCPLFPTPYILDKGASYSKEDFSKRFAPAIKGVVEFVQRIPGFEFLSQDDQDTLLKASIFEVLLVRLARMFDSHDKSLICLNGQVLRDESFFNDNNQIQLLNSMFEFADGLNSLRLSDKEVGLFCAIVATASNRPGLRNTDLVCKIQQKIKNILVNFMSVYRPETHFQDLMKKLDILHNLNTIHSKILLNNKRELSSKRAAGAIDGLTDNSVNNQSSYDSIPHNIESAYSMVSVHPPCFAPEKDFKSELLGQHSQHGGRTAGSGWSTTDFNKEHDLVGTSIHIGSGLCVDEIKKPVRTSSLSSSGTHENGEKWHKEVIQYVEEYHHTLPKRAFDNPGSEHRSSSGDNSYFSDFPIQGPVYPKQCRVDSPTDSASSHFRYHGPSTTTISIGSIPRFSVHEKTKDIDHDHASEGHAAIEDISVLKRPTQAPPIINPHDEAYRHHKKFGAARRKAK